EPVIDPGAAVAGVDEFLDNLPHAEYFAPNVAKLRGDGETIALRCDAAAWTIRLEPDAFTWSHGKAAATVVVESSATDLDLFVWGRRNIADADWISVSVDLELVRRWIDK